ncbi:hypothetical protein ATY38_02370 [Nitrosomonas ureae]|nr:hypothetical protein ATY38_02370 [Nitrosomonas ureae]
MQNLTGITEAFMDAKTMINSISWCVFSSKKWRRSGMINAEFVAMIPPLGGIRFFLSRNP